MAGLSVAGRQFTRQEARSTRLGRTDHAKPAKWTFSPQHLNGALQRCLAKCAAARDCIADATLSHSGATTAKHLFAMRNSMRQAPSERRHPMSNKEANLATDSTPLVLCALPSRRGEAHDRKRELLGKRPTPSGNRTWLLGAGTRRLQVNELSPGSPDPDCPRYRSGLSLRDNKGGAQEIPEPHCASVHLSPRGNAKLLHLPINCRATDAKLRCSHSDIPLVLSQHGE